MAKRPADKMTDTRFAKIAIVEKLITPSQARELLDQIEQARAQGRKPPSLANLLIDNDLITEKERRRLTARLRAPAPAPKADQMPEIPKRVGRYEILQQIGRGGMGDVYKARQLNMDRIVALKILPEGMARDKRYIRRFIREARAAGTLNHPNIVQVYDVGYTHGRYYFSMEFVEGKNSGRLLWAEDHLEPARAIDIGIQIARALGHAARHGIVHRDIKPENILVTPDGTAKLADLGLARRADGSPDETGTRHGMTMGTPYYMSIEQARSVSTCDHRSDLYSLGATLYHLATGKVPFDGDSSVDILMKAAEQPVVPPDRICAQVPAGLARIIEKMMAKAPGDRYQTAEELVSDLVEMREALDRGSQGDAIAERIGTAYTAARSPSTALVAVLFVAAIAAALIIGALIGRGGGIYSPPLPKPIPFQDPKQPGAEPPRTGARPQPPAGKAGEPELASAREFFAANPESYGEALARLGDVEKRFAGTAPGLAAADDITRIRHQREEVARRELFRRLAAAEMLAADGAYGAAADALKMPAALADSRAAAKAAAEAESMRERADADLWRLRRASAALVAAGALSEAAGLWDEAIDVWGIKPLVVQATRERDRIRQLMAAEAAAAARAAEKETELKKAMTKIDAPLGRWNFKRAAELAAAESTRVGSPAHREMLLERKERLLALARLKERLLAKINSMKPHLQTRTFSTNLLDGALVRADDDHIYVSLGERAETMQPWKRLTADDFLNLVKRLTSTRSVTDRLGQAVLHLELGRLSSAGRLLDRLVGEAPEAQGYLDQITRIHTRHAEKRASDLIESARALLSDGHFGACIEEIGRVLIEYSETRSLAGRRGMVSQLLARAEDGLAAKGGMAGKVLRADRGRLKWRYDFDSAGELADWTAAGDRLMLDAGRLCLEGGVVSTAFEVPLSGGLKVTIRPSFQEPETSSLAVRLIPRGGDEEREGIFGARISGGTPQLFAPGGRVAGAKGGPAPADGLKEVTLVLAAGTVRLLVDGKPAGELELDDAPQSVGLEIGMAGTVALDSVEIRSRPEQKWLEQLRAKRREAAREVLQQAAAARAADALGIYRQILRDFPDRREECCLAEFAAASLEIERGRPSEGIRSLRRALYLYPSQADRHHARIRAELDKLLQEADN